LDHDDSVWLDLPENGSVLERLALDVPVTVHVHHPPSSLGSPDDHVDL